MFIGGLAAGFVLGARAGREKHEELVVKGRKVLDHPTVQEAAGVAQAQANRLYSEGKDKIGQSKIGEKLSTGNGSSGMGSSSTSSPSSSSSSQSGNTGSTTGKSDDTFAGSAAKSGSSSSASVPSSGSSSATTSPRNKPAGPGTGTSGSI
jgi:hypothetical protein